MTKPNVTIGSSLGFKEETTAGTKISLASGASFLDILSINLQYLVEKYNERSLVGTRVQQSNFEILSHHNGNGAFTCRARRPYMDELLKMFLGGVAGQVYTPILNNTELVSFTFEGNLAAANNIRLIGCKGNQIILKSEAGQPLIIEGEIIARSGERDPGDLTTAVYTDWTSSNLFMHSNLSIASADATYLANDLTAVKAIELMCKNNLKDDDFTNATTRQFISEGIFESTLKLTVPYNSTTKGFWAMVAALTVVNISCVWSDGANTITLAYKCRCDSKLPEITEVTPKFIDLEFHPVAALVAETGMSITLA